jgi:hypothetical protein
MQLKNNYNPQINHNFDDRNDLLNNQYTVNEMLSTDLKNDN